MVVPQNQIGLTLPSIFELANLYPPRADYWTSLMCYVFYAWQVANREMRQHASQSRRRWDQNEDPDPDPAQWLWAIAGVIRGIVRSQLGKAMSTWEMLTDWYFRPTDMRRWDESDQQRQFHTHGHPIFNSKRKPRASCQDLSWEKQHLL